MADRNTIATAYVQIKPSMEGVQGELSQAFGEEGESAGNTFGGKFAGALKAASGAAVVAVGAATTAVGAMVKESVDGFAEYEQLKGGVETLFGKDAQTVLTNAGVAFQSAGMSMNEYMETSIQSAAALINSLEGDTAEAARLMDMSIIDMSDNVNKMGTSMESVQNAYRGFSRGNFTMLDNLALGFAGTKDGMQQLLDKAQEISGIEYNLDSYSDIVQAIHVVQEEMGIAGTTEKEGAETIEGSLARTKAAWDNLITGMARDDVNLGALIDNLVDSAAVAFDNIEPVIERALVGVGKFVSKAIPSLMQKLPHIINEVLPELISTGAQAVGAIGQGIIDNLPELANTALQLLSTLATGLSESLPTLIPSVVEAVMTIAEGLLDNIDLVIDAAIQLIIGLAEGLINALPVLIEKIPVIVEKLVSALIENAPKLLEAAAQLIGKLVEGIFINLPGLLAAAGEIIVTIVAGIFDFQFKLDEAISNIIQMITDAFTGLADAAISWGADMIEGFIDGIGSMAQKLWDSVCDIADGIAKFLGFSEPEKGPLSNFHTYAPDMMELFAKGIRDNEKLVTAQIEHSFNFGGKIKEQEALRTAVQDTPVYSMNAAELQVDNRETGELNDQFGEAVKLLGKLVDKEPVELSANTDGIFDLMRRKDGVYFKANGRSAFA